MSSAAAADVDVDVAVVGGGPAGYMMAALLGRAEHSVALIDPKPDGVWPNNYGSWREEWESLASTLQMPELRDCVSTHWAKTDCFFGGSFDTPDDERTTLDRAYLKVDRKLLKATLQEKHAAAGVQLLQGFVPAIAIAPNLFDGGLVHDTSGSTLNVKSADEAETTVRAKLVVDATGFESKLTVRESPAAGGLWRELTPGYQIAYGMCVDVEDDDIAPYDKSAMTLFDYRTDHLAGSSLLSDAEERPSFVYVMPVGECDGCGASAFFEETSLVGRGERRLEFETLKQRLLKRLDYHNIKYDPDSVREEEYCYIPMGGNLPEMSQRIVPIGGAANTVHPATGYQLCRMLASAPGVADALTSELRRPDFDPDAAAAAAHASLWPEANRLQRDFAVFGGEFLGAQPVEILRGFFGAFFALPMDVWGGFLAGWPGLPGNDNHATYLARIKFGLSIALKFPPKVAAIFVGYLAKFSTEFGPMIVKSIFTPVFQIGVGPAAPDPGLRARRERAREVYQTGDAAAKKEAVAMLKAGRTPGKEPKGEPSPQVELLEAEAR